MTTEPSNLQPKDCTRATQVRDALDRLLDLLAEEIAERLCHADEGSRRQVKEGNRDRGSGGVFPAEEESR
jgi:hypothetical protein